MRLEFSLPIFEKYSNISFNENPSSKNGAVPSKLAERRTDRQTVMTKLWSLFAMLPTRRIKLIISYVFFWVKPLKPELNPPVQRCLTRFFTGNFASLTVHFVNICVKPNKYTNYSFSLLIMYGSSYMFRYYIAIFRERS
jgi:hypothetical protein